MKHYSVDVIKNLLSAAAKGDIEIKTFNDYNELPKFVNIGGFDIKLLTSEDGHKDVLLNCKILSMPKDDVREWRHEGHRRFYVMDWKHINKGEDQTKNYVEVTFKFQDMHVIGLLRKLTNEDKERFLAENSVIDIYDYMKDLFIDGDHYNIIKLYIKDFEQYSMPSQLEETISFEPIFNQFCLPVNPDGTDDDDDADDGLADAVSQELF